LTWNVSRPLLADARVRRALAALTPMQEVSRALDRGTSRVADCPFAPGSPGCEPSLKAAAPAPEDASRLLAEAGWGTVGEDGGRSREGARLTVQLLIPEGSSGTVALFEVLQRAWRQGGVELQITSLPWEALQARLTGSEFDAVALLWAF